MKRALVLAGGGARGAFQVGMLEHLVVDQGLDFSVLRGVSVGALNASFLAQAKAKPSGSSLGNLKRQVRKLSRLWTREIEGDHSVFAKRAGFAGLAAGADSLYSLKPLRGLIQKHVKLKRLRESGRDFRVGTVSLVSGDYHEWSPTKKSVKDFLELLVASASIPVAFPFIDLPDRNEILVDGGVRNVTPLSSAFASKPDEIYVLLTSRVIPADGDLEKGAVVPQTYRQWDDNFLGTRVSGIDVLARTIEILTDEIYLDDIRGAITWNGVLAAIEGLQATLAAQPNSPPAEDARDTLTNALADAKKRHVPIKVIAPRKWFGTKNDSTNFDPTLIADAVDHGRAIAANPDLWVVS